MKENQKETEILSWKGIERKQPTKRKDTNLRRGWLQPSDRTEVIRAPNKSKQRRTQKGGKFWQRCKNVPKVQYRKIIKTGNPIACSESGDESPDTGS